MAASAYQKQYKARGKKARTALAKTDRNVRKRLGRVAAAQQRLSDALARLVRLNQVYGTTYPEQTDLSAGFDDYSAGARQLVDGYAVVEALPALAAVPEVAGGRALAGEAIFGEMPTGPPPAPLRLTGAVLRGTNPADGGRGGAYHHRPLRGWGYTPDRGNLPPPLGHPLCSGRAPVPGRSGGATRPLRCRGVYGRINALAYAARPVPDGGDRPFLCEYGLVLAMPCICGYWQPISPKCVRMTTVTPGRDESKLDGAHTKNDALRMASWSLVNNGGSL